MEKIYVKVRTRVKNKGVKKIDSTHFEVAVNAAPEKVLANKAVLKALANCLNISVSRLSITSGATWNNKIIEIQ